MFIFQRSAALAIITALSVLTPLARAAAQQPQPHAASDADRKLADAVATFVRVFNAHDAAGLAKLWKPDAVHVAKATGARTTGRPAIEQAYAALFKEDPKCQVHITVSQLRFVTPTVANLECVADVAHTSGETSRSEFSAILVQDGGGWLIDQVHETDVPFVAPATAQLSELAWLQGTWSDEAKDSRVTNETHWALGNRFLVRSYQMEQGGAVTRDGTQVIGWDAEHKCLRSWLFDSSGSFGEGTWQASGDNKWTNKMVLKLADGHRGSLTQVFKRAGGDKMTIETIDREIDGAAQPNGAPVTLIRANGEQTPRAENSAKGDQR